LIDFNDASAIEVKYSLMYSAVHAVSQAPPRPAEDSTQQIEMSGYSAARSEFTIEHNNFAELDIRDITLTDNNGSLDAGKQ